MVQSKKEIPSPDQPVPAIHSVNDSFEESSGAVESEHLPEYSPAEDESAGSEPLPPVGELKGAVLKALREDRFSLAAAMEKSESWVLNGNTLSLTFNSPFESTFIEKECREIEGIIRKSLGWDVRINTVIKEREDESRSEDLEEQVELVRNIFRGTIINRSSK